jgi:hypothetical protein
MPQVRARLFVLAGLFLTFSGPGKGEAKPVNARICAVALQDHGGRAVGYSDLDKRHLKLLKEAGFQPVAIPFQPSADLERAARDTSCRYILYSDIIDMRRTAGGQLASAVKGVTGTQGKTKREIWEAEVEFRLFVLDQVQPLLSTSTRGRNIKGPTPPRTEAGPPDILLDQTPAELTGRQLKHRSLAVASALEKGVKLVRNKITDPGGER